MARFKDRQKALLLRKKGMSYSQIKQELGISKSTLSGWLKDYPLSKQRISELQSRNEARIENLRQTMQRKREARLLASYQEQNNQLLPLSARELLLAGIFLYWGEGDKSSNRTLGIYNTDPTMVVFAFYWLTHGLNIPQSQIKIRLHLYSDMDTQEEIGYWSRLLGLPTQDFKFVYVKQNKRSDIDRKGFGHGTVGLVTYNVLLKERISMAIKAIGDYYGKLAT